MSLIFTSRGMAPIVCLALLSGCISTQASYKATRQIVVPHESASAIRVDTPNGDVALQLGNGPDVQIEANLSCTRPERLDETQIVANRVNGTLNVEVKWPDGRRENGEGCSFTITLPDATGVEVQTSNGAIKSTGLAGTARLSTSNGRIVVANHNGAVDARSRNGRIDIQNAQHQVDASTSNGRISVTLADTFPGPVHLRTSNGRIDLTIGSSFSSELKMSTSNGGLDIDEFANAKRILIRNRSGSIVFGEGGEISELHTSNGTIHVRGAAKP